MAPSFLQDPVAVGLLAVIVGDGFDVQGRSECQRELPCGVGRRLFDEAGSVRSLLAAPVGGPGSAELHL
jgi:hypothetical protein